MNGDEPVVDSHGPLVPLEHVVVVPVASMCQERCQMLADQARFDTKVGLAAPLGSSPTPNVTEHPLVEREEEPGFQ